MTGSNYALRPNDLYETEPWAVFALVRQLKVLGLWRNGIIWEPAAGNRALLGPLMNEGAQQVITSDIVEYDFKHGFIFDFLSPEEAPEVPADYDLITNPPYGHGNRLAKKFAERALSRCSGYVALLLTAKFDFGSTRTHLFRDNDRFAAKVALMDRISWAGNGKTGTEDHAWFIWGPKDSDVTAPQLLYERKYPSRS